MIYLIIIIWLIGTICSYYLVRYCFKKQFNLWEYSDVLFFGIGSLFMSWIGIFATFVMFTDTILGGIKINKNKPPKWL